MIVSDMTGRSNPVPARVSNQDKKLRPADSGFGGGAGLFDALVFCCLEATRYGVLDAE